MINRVFFILVAFLVSCSKPNEESVILSASEKEIVFKIPDDVRIPLVSLFPFVDKEKDYLSFANYRKNEIIIYDVESTELMKRVEFASEGNNAIIGGFGGYHIVDMNHVFVPSIYMSTIYVTDTTAVVKSQINYQKAQNGLLLVPFIPGYASQMNIIGDSLYIPQVLNKMLKDKIVSESPVGVVVDTVSGNINTLPFTMPPLIADKDFGTATAGSCDYSSCYDGTNFIYAFFFDENIYMTPSKHEVIEKKVAKSKYIDKIEVFKSSEPNLQKMVKLQCEHASYGQIMFDKYREVYYRFVYPSADIDDYEGDYVDLLRSGRKAFSIMVLDKQLNVMGETLFPEYTYNPKLSFILEDGLYISLNHIKNPEYSDDLLRFQRIELNKR